MTPLKISKATSRQIARMGLLCAMLVVFIHSYQFLTLNGKDSALAAILEELLSQGVALVAVPYFFLVSGFFLYRDYEFSRAWFVRKMKSRIVSLVVPYVLWGVIAMAFTFCCSLVAEKLSESPIDFKSIRWWLQVLGVTQKPLYVGQLWFVRMILEWLCLAPFVGWLVRRFGFWVPALCLVVQCIPVLANPWIHALLFISIGASMALSSDATRICLKNLTANRKMSVAIVAVWIAMLSLRTYFALAYGGEPHRWRCILFGIVLPYELIMKSIGIAAVWLAFGKIKDSGVWKWLDPVLGSSFFVYCTHQMFLALFRSPLRRLPMIWESDMLRYLLPPVLAIGLGIAVWKFLERSFPALMKVICGGRG